MAGGTTENQAVTEMWLLFLLPKIHPAPKYAQKIGNVNRVIYLSTASSGGPFFKSKMGGEFTLLRTVRY